MGFKKFSFHVVASVTTEEDYSGLLTAMNEGAASLGNKVIVTLCQADRASALVAGVYKYNVQVSGTIMADDTYAGISNKLAAFASGLGESVIVTLLSINQWVNQETMAIVEFDSECNVI